MIFTLLFGLFGLAVLIGVAVAFSDNRRAIDWRLVLTGVALQLAFAVVVLLLPGGRAAFAWLSRMFVTVIGFAQDGAVFIFGPMADVEQMGFIFGIQVAATIIFFASLMGVLYHLNVMQKVVQGMAWVMQKVLGTSGAETLSVTANVFIGQIEAPLVVKPYIPRMTESELLTMMVGGMATIAGAVMAAYIGLLGGADEAARQFYAHHLLTASVMAAPATIVIAKLLKPERDEPLTRGSVKVHVESESHNVIEAAANGAADGLKMALSVLAMLLAFISLLALIDWPLGWLGEVTGLEAAVGEPLSLSLILGVLLSPLSWVIGVPWEDAVAVGGLIGTKVVANEFVAYVQLAEIKDTLGPKSVLIATYALCGFANFSSIAIQLGGIGQMAPSRRTDIARFGLKAVLGGTLATMMTATIAGVLTSLAG